jgi:hypothetical protein
MSCRWQALQLSARAALMCKHPEFQAWLPGSGMCAYPLAGEGEQATIIRLRAACKVTTRATLNTDDKAAARYRAIEAAYFAMALSPPMPEE